MTVASDLASHPRMTRGALQSYCPSFLRRHGAGVHAAETTGSPRMLEEVQEVDRTRSRISSGTRTMPRSTSQAAYERCQAPIARAIGNSSPFPTDFIPLRRQRLRFHCLFLLDFAHFPRLRKGASRRGTSSWDFQNPLSVSNR